MRDCFPVDDFDLKILTILQQDADRPVAEVAAAVGLSASPCWRRIQRLKEAGVIRRQVALVDRAALNLDVTVFVAIRTQRHAIDWLERFHAALADIPEIVEAWRLSGETDYLLKVVVPSISAYDEVYKQLISKVELFDVSSSFAMEELKCTTALPTSRARR
ncbi:MAG: Lrp/AsnC family transcriptional regulator [Thalassobaculales bacterium]